MIEILIFPILIGCFGKLHSGLTEGGCEGTIVGGEIGGGFEFRKEG